MRPPTARRSRRPRRSDSGQRNRGRLAAVLLSPSGGGLLPVPQRSRACRVRVAVLLAALLAAGGPGWAAAPDDAPLPRPAPRSAGEAPAEVPPPVPRPATEPDEPAAPAEAPPPPPLPGTPDRPAPPEDPPEAAETEEPPAEEAAGPDAEPSPYAVLASPLPPKRPGLSGSTLIGIFALTTGRTALMRFPSGEVRRLSIGDEVDGWRVDAIAKDSLRFARGGRARTFLLMGN